MIQKRNKKWVTPHINAFKQISKINESKIGLNCFYQLPFHFYANLKQNE